MKRIASRPPAEVAARRYGRFRPGNSLQVTGRTRAEPVAGRNALSTDEASRPRSRLVGDRTGLSTL